ncbi:E3 ubiquitin-protein -like ligase [Sarcoptes scabiei]|uniref:RING-type E3 ubiquitin transferase n=1 Tax=Sarcoptes scabiei TaxID=52283 RepID=A0A834R362_SARSC|nr:E3 ubiquitin-protein -like ligase [Sarcoptes scabiei]UXI17229.1 Apoptosis-stimulating of p53 protein 2 [Sarcoptes scabiei]
MNNLVEKRFPSSDSDNVSSYTPKCSICLEDILNLTFANHCHHSFCFDCIRQWIRFHNKCPLCRQRIQFITFNFRSNEDYDRIDVQPPVVQQEYVQMISNDFYLISTPEQSGLYLIFPFLDGGRIYYNQQFLRQGQNFIIRNSDPGTLFVLPEDLEQVLSLLENVSIYRYRQHFGRHPLFLKEHRDHRHHNHRQRDNNP